EEIIVAIVVRPKRAFATMAQDDARTFIHVGILQTAEQQNPGSDFFLGLGKRGCQQDQHQGNQTWQAVLPSPLNGERIPRNKSRLEPLNLSWGRGRTLQSRRGG